MRNTFFKKIINTHKIALDISLLKTNLRDKKIVVLGSKVDFVILDKIYSLSDTLTIVAIADAEMKSKPRFIKGIKTINPSDIEKEDFDIILSILIDNPQIQYLPVLTKYNTVNLFEENIKDEYLNLEYLFVNNFDKTFPILTKNLTGKKVLVYSTGVFFETINKYFDLSKLNIIGVSDSKYNVIKDNDKFFLGYKKYKPSEIKGLQPDYVLVATKYYIVVIQDLYYDILKGSNIKIRPLVKKKFMVILRELFCNNSRRG